MSIMRILSLGAGVQSSTLALMAAKEGKLKVDAAIFADTQAEPAAVMEWLETLKQLVAKQPHSFPIYVTTAGDLEAETLILRKSKKTGSMYIRTLIPAFYKTNRGRGLLGRKCTAEYKVRALLKKQREIAKVKRGEKNVVVESLIGISMDEVQRMKDSTVPWARNVWPLIDMGMTRRDCLKWMEENGFPKPPRSACYFCPFHSDKEWMRLRDEEPEEFRKAVEYDKKLRDMAEKQTGKARMQGKVYLHSSLQPLDEVKFTEKDQLDLFGNDCTGLCGI